MVKEFMKLILSAFKLWAGRKIDDGIKNSVADWNQCDTDASDYIKNRTHWEEVEELQLDVQWDGAIDDRFHISPIDGVAFVKVSDYAPTFEEAKNALVSYIAGDKSFDDIPIMSMDGIEEINDGDGKAWVANVASESLNASTMCVGAVTNGPINYKGIQLNETGLYFLTDTIGLSGWSPFRITRLKVATTQHVVHKISTKYLHTPDLSVNDPSKPGYVKNRTHWEGPLSIEWNGSTVNKCVLSGDGLNDIFQYVKVSEYTPAIDSLKSVSIYGEGFDLDTAMYRAVSYTDAVAAIEAYTTNIADPAIPMVLVAYAPGVIGNYTITETGTYFAFVDDHAWITKLYLSNGDIHKLPAKYLPAGIPYEESPDIDIYWDGNIGGSHYTYDEFDKVAYIWLSDLVPTYDDMIGCTVVVRRKSSQGDVTDFAENMTVLEDNDTKQLVIFNPQLPDVILTVVPEPTGIFDSAGIYAGSYTYGVHISELHIKGVRRNLGGKYLPEGTPWVENTGEDIILPATKLGVEGVIQRDGLLGLIEGERYRVTYKGVNYECTCKPVEATYEGLPAFAYYIGNGFLIDRFTGVSHGIENTGEPFLISDFMNVKVTDDKVTDDTYFVMNQAILGAMYPNEDDTISITHIKQEYHDVPEKNRTHWSEKTDVPLDIRFDPRKKMRYYCPGSGVLQTWVHLSDRMLTIDELVNCSLQLADGSIINPGGVTIRPSDYGRDIEITSDDYSDCVLMIVDTPIELAIDARPGVYVKVETETPSKQVVRIYSKLVTTPGLKYHKLPSEYVPEIPIIDLANFEIDAIAPNGQAIIKSARTAKDPVAFAAHFYDAIQAFNSGVVRVRASVYAGEDSVINTDGYVTLMKNTNFNVWGFIIFAPMRYGEPLIQYGGRFDEENMAIEIVCRQTELIY